MPNVSLCPSPNDLRRFALGDVHEAEAQTLEQHLDTCARCLETLEDQGVGDTLVESLRGPIAAQTAVPDDLVEDMVQRIGTLRHNAAAPTQQTDAFNTPAVDRGIDTPTTGAEQPTGDLSAAEDLDFLAPAEEPGDLGRLGGYRVLKWLGSGGMGVVFVAEDLQLLRRVALKVMRPALAASKAARQRFLREARLAAKIEHDHLVHIYQVGEDEGMPFLAMQLLKGETLEERLRRQESGVKGQESGVRDQGSGVRDQESGILDTLRVGREIAEGLAAAHAQGLIHRDIKPANVFLAQASAQAKAHGQPSVGFGRVKILDFGLARAVEDDAHITGSGVIAGTPAYMAPEQARAEAVDARTDLFSLGCVLYRMLVGRTPFRGANTTAMLMSLANDSPPAPTEANPTTPKELSDLVMRLLAKNPAERPTSARAVVEALTAIERQLQGDKVTSAEDAKVTRWQGDKVTSEDTVSVTESPGHPVTLSLPLHVSRTRRWLVAAAMLTALVIGGWYLAQIVLRVPTDHGELIVEVEGGADLQVEVRDKKIIFAGKQTQKQHFELRPGPGVVVFRDLASGIELFSERFTLEKGREFRIVAMLKKVEAARAKLGDPDRRVAEWALSLPYPIMDVDVGGKREKIDKRIVKELPRAPFKIVELHISDSGVSDDDLKRLQDLTELERLNVPRNPITAAGLRHLKPLKKLHHLTVSRIGDREMAIIGELTGMKILIISNSTAVTDAGLEHVKRLSSLEILQVESARVSDEGLRHLGGLPKLIVISFKGLPISGMGFKYLTELPLSNVGLGSCAITDAGLARLSESKSPHPIGLQLNNTSVSDAGLEHLKRMSRLAELSVRETKVSLDGVKKLAAALPKCKIESDHGTFGPAADADRRVAEWVLKIGGEVTVFRFQVDKEPVRFKPGAKLPAEPFEVREIRLSPSIGVFSEKDLALLTPLTGLRYLSLSTTYVSDDAMRHVAALRRLPRLDLQVTKVTDAGLEQLRGLTNLVELNVRQTKVTLDGVRKMQAALPKCKIVSDHGTFAPKTPVADAPGSPAMLQLLDKKGVTVAELPAGGQPPARNMFAGQLIFYDTCDDPKTTRLFLGVRQSDGSRFAIDNGAYVHSHAKAATKENLWFVPPGSAEDEAFALRWRATTKTSLNLGFANRTTGVRSRGLVFSAWPNGHWSIVQNLRVLKNDKWTIESSTEMAASLDPMPELTRGDWLTFCGRVTGSSFELWIDGRLIAHGVMEQLPESKSMGVTDPGGIQEVAGPFRLEIDWLAIWRLR